MSDRKALIQQAIQLVDEVSRAFEQTISSATRRATGSYYTSVDLCIPMMEELIDALPPTSRAKLHTLTFLEPCVGTGNFVFAYILAAAKHIPHDKLLILLENIYVSDINAGALAVYKTQLQNFVHTLYGITLDDDYFVTHVGNGLLFDITDDTPTYLPLTAGLPSGAPSTFDIVATNPPYKNLKAELPHYDTGDATILDKQRYMAIRGQAKQLLPLASTGTLNLYKLFTEEILERYAAPNAIVSLLIPSSILTDKTCEALRTRIVESWYIRSIKNIREKNPFISANQALTAILIDKSASPQHTTNITQRYTGPGSSSIDITIAELANHENGYTILALTREEIELLRKMNTYPKIKDLPFITNLRGELDLTLDKTAITHTKTTHPLLRGRNIGYYHITSTEPVEYVERSFIMASQKAPYIKAPRLACQQIANIAKERRLVFAPIQKDTVLANSCNFIAVNDNDYGVTLPYVMGILNSKLLNWYFKIHSSNNHINNYEIDNFPLPIEGREVQQITKLITSNDIVTPDIQDAIDSLVGNLFKTTHSSIPAKPTIQDHPQSVYNDLAAIIPTITTDEIESIIDGNKNAEPIMLRHTPALSRFDRNVVDGITTKYAKLRAGQLLNHTTFKLSDLDLEMIRPIPQGGNWKDIPIATVAKSKRLMRITETGGRTTLYGRLAYDKPSYTITTYFNRPGNGTYVHPIHDRVLSVREAARLQSFPDSFYFYGNKTQLLKQIGNAVPPLLAYQIGKKILTAIGPATSIDLFCGAGGLTHGFEQAGIHTIMCTDFNEAACTTLKINHPTIDVICGDITDDAVRDNINAAAKVAHVDVICGGPPCQGFSMAGYRDTNDPRNQLFREFVKVVEHAKPKVVVFENVEGIMSFNKGETYQAIHDLFGELGYRTSGKLLRADNFGVPQKRKRVIIICTRIDLDIDPESLYPEPLTTKDDKKTTVADTLQDLESTLCSETAVTPPHQGSPYNAMLRGELSMRDFAISLAPHDELPARQLSLFADESALH